MVQLNPPLTKDRWFIKYPILHRGYHWLPGVDENSWEAIELGIKQGLPIEFDVHLSRDGHPYVHHDLSLKRMTGKDLLGTELDQKELIQIKTTNSSYGIPLLREVLRRVRGQVPLVIEVKRTRTDFALEEAIWEIVKDYKGEFSVQGFHPGTLNYFRRQKAGFPLGLLSGSLEGEKVSYPLKVMIKSLCLSPFIKPSYIGYEWSLLAKRAPQRIREAYGIPLLGWTVKDEKARLFCERFADNIIFENLKNFSKNS